MNLNSAVIHHQDTKNTKGRQVFFTSSALTRRVKGLDPATSCSWCNFVPLMTWW